MSKAKSIIKIENLTKSYKGTIAVNNISFEVFEGEIFGLLGPNGAGKTTTLEMIETLRLPDSGEIWVDGLSVTASPDEVKQKIGVQLQQAGFYPGLSLVELLELFAGLYGVEIDSKEILARVNLEEKANAKYNSMSGGQKQRFSIATTLINSPRVIFLDEPTTGLDPQARRNLWELIKEIRDKGTTVVITTHYMDEAEVLCDRVGIMNNGELVKLDTPENMIDKLLESGFTPHRKVKEATLEDVFLNLTGKQFKH